MEWLICLLAQAQPASQVDYLNSGIGLAGLLVNGGVLGWLLFIRIPAWDKINKEKDDQIKHLIETRDRVVDAKDKQIQSIIGTHREQIETKDKQIQLLIDSRDKLFKETSECHDQAFAIAEKDRRADFQGSLQTVTTHYQGNLEAVVKHCENEAALMREMIRKDLAEQTAITVDMRRTMEELRETIYTRPSHSYANPTPPSPPTSSNKRGTT